MKASTQTRLDVLLVDVASLAKKAETTLVKFDKVLGQLEKRLNKP